MKDPVSKKISFYFSDEILNYENKTHKFSFNESLDDSKLNLTVHKITDINITNLIEDLEYEDLKKNSQNKEYFVMKDFYSNNSGITNNNIDTYQTYKSIS